MPADCPADVETLGRSTWTLLHSIAATYPVAPTPNHQTDLKMEDGVEGREMRLEVARHRPLKNNEEAA